MSGNMLGSGGKMTLHIRRNRKSVRRYGERRTRIMIRIGMRLIRNTRKVGRRRVGNGMRMILRIGRWRSNGGGSLHRIIRTIRRSGGCICGSIVSGRRRRGRRNSFQFEKFTRCPPTKEVLPQESSADCPTEDSIRIGLTKPSHKRVFPRKARIVLESGLQSPPTRESFGGQLSDSIRIGSYKALPQESSFLPIVGLESGIQSPPTKEFLPTEDSIRIGVTKPSHKRVPSYKEQIVLESGLQSPPTKEFLPTEDSIRIGLTKPSHKRVPSYRR